MTTYLFPFGHLGTNRNTKTNIYPFNRLVRDRNVVTSIGQGTTHSENVNISSTSGVGPYKVNLASTVPSTIVVGDALWDEHATPRAYRIIATGSGTELTVVDSTGVGSAPDSSGTSQAVVERYYNGSTPITDWESELDDTDLYSSGDDAVGECYNDDVFNESVTINGGGTVGLNSVTLTVAETDRHDGTAGAGACIAYTGLTTIVTITNANRTVDISWLEVRNAATGGLNSAQNRGILYTQDGQGTVNNNIIHSIPGSTFVSSRVGIGIDLSGTRTDVEVVNNTVYNIGGNQGTTSGTDNSGGIGVTENQAAGHYLANNTVYRVLMDASDTYFGIGVNVPIAGALVYNNLSIGSESEDYNSTATTFTTNASSDTTGNSGLQSLIDTNQFVSTASGFEDLHLKSGADAIDAGTDLATTPTGVNIDIDGNDREGMVGNTDIGAHQYYADYDKVVTTIGQGTSHDENVTITSVTGTGPYLITLSAVSGAVRGDAFYDEVGNAYRIIEVDDDGDVFSVVDSTGSGVPDDVTGGTPTVERYYNGSTPLTDWESELDDTDLYSSGDDAVGECYNDTTFTNALQINGGASIGLSSITLTVAEDERHNGVANAGVKLTNSSANYAIDIATTVEPVNIEWVEIYDFAAPFSFHGILVTGNADVFIKNVIVRDCNTGSATDVIGIAGRSASGPNLTVMNSFVYNIINGSRGYGIHLRWSGQSYNNTIYNCQQDGVQASGSGKTATNTIAMVSGGSDFGTGLTVQSYNISSDNTDSGTGSIGPDDGVGAASTQFVSTVGGMEDLRLKSGADAIDAGTDLGTTPTSVNIDIAGRDRDAEGDTWDIGAHEFVATGTPIGNSTITLWNVYETGGYAQTLTWNVNGVATPIGNEVDFVWNVYDAIGNISLETWDIYETTGNTIQQNWHILETIGKHINTLWNIFELIDRVSSNTWNINELAGKNSANEWNVLELIRNDQEFIWNELQSAGFATEHNWKILQSIGNISNYEWNLLAPAGISAIGNTLTFLWNVRQIIGENTNIDWDDNELISQNTEVDWRINELASNNVQPVWNIRQNISNNIHPEWNLNELISNVLEPNWNITINAGTQTSAAWNINKVVGNYKIQGWNILQNIGATQSVLWNTLITIAVTKPTTWNVLKTAAADSLEINWNVYKLSGREQEILWNVISGLEIDNIYEFSLLIQMIKDIDAAITKNEIF